ncbi:MAG: urease accessory protein UreD, partial [Staphylococcus epidermidis]|nr:urease accessory protein UreD [Staphylococcus epidermidis]
VRILTKRTQIIEEILTRVQSYINQTIYHRQINFLRKY